MNNSAGIGVPAGTYTQISVNWHAYVDIFNKLNDLPRPSVAYIAHHGDSSNPYENGLVHFIPMPDNPEGEIKTLLYDADSGYESPRLPSVYLWSRVLDCVLRSHHLWRIAGKEVALEHLSKFEDQGIDWIFAMKEWLERRKK